MKIRALIVDDELLARKRIKHLLADEQDIEIAGEAVDGSEAVAAIRKLKPDLVFLDVQIPEMDGFDVLAELEPDKIPSIIFVTAYDHFTLRAFDYHAIDYLLKPFSEDRFRHAVVRARERLRSKDKGEVNDDLAALLEQLNANKKHLERLVVNSNNRLIVLLTWDIDYIETYGNYVRIYHAGKFYLLRETLNNLAARLEPDKFIRIHRSTLVNIERITELHPMFGGQYAVILRDGTELTLSRSYRQNVLKLFGL